MNDSIRTRSSRNVVQDQKWFCRSTSWLAITGSLVCLVGCAGPLTRPNWSNGPQAHSQSNADLASTQVSFPQPQTPHHVPGANPIPGANPVTHAVTQHAGDEPTTVQQSIYQVKPGADASQQVELASDDGRHVAYQNPGTAQPFNFTPPSGPPLPPGSNLAPTSPSLTGPGLNDAYGPVYPTMPRIRQADLVINGFPARTGRIMLGGAVNSDAGVTGQLTIDERNFDIMRWPTSFQDLFSGTAFRGAGQTFRIEAAPGTDFKRYTMQFADPNLFGYRPVSMSVSGFLYDRRFNDWDEERLGGRLAFGYRVTPDLSLSVGVSGQNVDISRPRVVGIPQLDAVVGDNEYYSGEVSLKHDTRDSPIQASQGHYFDFTFEEVFGDFDYARFELEFRRYWLLAQRADSSGKQTISYSTKVGFSGKETPLFENFFAGGYATIRGFEFRGASPKVNGVEVGGRFQWLNTVEYMFPITADDAFRGVAFVDFGTVEQDIEIKEDNYRVAPGMGLRVAIPMLGPAPLAFDFAYPVAMADTDERRIFSFYMSLIR